MQNVCVSQRSLAHAASSPTTYAAQLAVLLWLAGKAGYVCGHAAVAAASNWSSVVRLYWLQ